jgi:uncharacterized protein YdhG (YjbR/CyaY superfamily)
MTSQKPTTVDEYIANAPPAVQAKLYELRTCLQKAAPNAEEMLKWGQPAFVVEYILFVYAGFKDHISLHPTPEAIHAFKEELKAYKTLNNTIQFSLNTPLPIQLISNIAAFRVKQSKQGVTWK